MRKTRKTKPRMVFSVESDGYGDFDPVFWETVHFSLSGIRGWVRNRLQFAEWPEEPETYCSEQRVRVLESTGEEDFTNKATISFIIKSCENIRPIRKLDCATLKNNFNLSYRMRTPFGGPIQLGKAWLARVLLATLFFAVQAAPSLWAQTAQHRQAPKREEHAPSQRLRSLAKLSGQGKPSAKTLLELRRLAESARDPEERGEAYFVLGYREYETAQYPAAEKDLGEAAATKFILEDYARFYGAAAAVEGRQPGEAIAPLEGFAGRYPESPLRHQATVLLAQAAIDAGRPELAVQTLAASPQLHREPAQILLLARAYGKAEKWGESARAFQELYYTHPASPEASAAPKSLEELRERLGARFPPVTQETRTARPEALLRHGRYEDALRDYDGLLREGAASPLADRWRVGRAQCLLRLNRAEAAAEALAAARASNPETEAERLATLAEAEERRDDVPALTRALDQLSSHSRGSPFRAGALLAAAGFFARRGDWAAAGGAYRQLATDFPDSPSGLEASWRAAWTAYLQRQTEKAQQDFTDHLVRYPASGHNPGALYWLGRLAEGRGAVGEARGFYQLAVKRYAQTYYGLEASRRLKHLKGLEGLKDKMGGEAAGPSLVSRLAETVAPPGSAPALCAAIRPHPPDGTLGRFLVLHALSLDSLAYSYLQDMLAERPQSVGLRYALGRFAVERGEPDEAIVQARDLVPDYADFRLDALPKEIWDLLYPRPYWNLVRQQARADGLDPYLVMGLIRQESGFNPRATSRANARGLMQMLPGTAVFMGPREAAPGRRGRRRVSREAVARQLYRPDYNIRLSCRHLRGLIKTFKGNLAEALAAYNAGDSRVKEWLEQGAPNEPVEFTETIPFGETRAYVKSVLRDAAIYRGLLAGSAKFKKCG